MARRGLTYTPRTNPTDGQEVVVRGDRLILRDSKELRRAYVALPSVSSCVFGAVVGVLDSGLSLRAIAIPALAFGGCGLAFGLLAACNCTQWILDRQRDALLREKKEEVARLSEIVQIQVKGEERLKEHRLVHYVTLVFGDEGKIPLGRWTPDRVGSVVASLEAFLQVPVVQKGELMPATPPESAPNHT